MGKHTFKLQLAGQERSASVDILEVKDIVMFVAGTTDPINTVPANHQANKTYWQGENGDLNNLWSQVKALKPQYLDLHIEDSFFSWSGDNNHEARTRAAERLLDLFLRVYSGWTDKEVFLHLIGHSHGGNVINQFTEIIATAENFPQQWSVKSITYLSTPFFQEQHQLNLNKLHPDCKIINVHNEYDITQRFVADFSLKNLEVLLSNFKSSDFKNAIETIQATDFDVFSALGTFRGRLDNTTEGPPLWTQTANLLEGIEALFEKIIAYVNQLEDTGVLSNQKAELLARLGEILGWASTQRPIFQRNRANRAGGYDRDAFFEDFDFLGVLRIANRFFAIENGVEDSYLLGLLDRISSPGGTGITDRIDDTSWTPENQVNGAREIIPVPIFTHDAYDSRNKKAEYDQFISGIENCVKENRPDAIRELLMRLLSQLAPPDTLTPIIDGINKLEWVITKETDRQAKALKRNFVVYRRLMQEFHADLVTTADQENEKLDPKPGSLPYLATVSHSLSHKMLYSDVESQLRAAFGSGKNPGYQR
ncbi:hypothetical protein [Spongiimicrobium salis]|uniref:hypothetical protein n=1 Tax=Spongiimicrobium salis TaxID=1667022 RepID=UPI00374DDA3A